MALTLMFIARKNKRTKTLTDSKILKLPNQHLNTIRDCPLQWQNSNYELNWAITIFINNYSEDEHRAAILSPHFDPFLDMGHVLTWSICKLVLQSLRSTKRNKSVEVHDPVRQTVTRWRRWTKQKRCCWNIVCIIQLSLAILISTSDLSKVRMIKTFCILL